jgi:hypothetical protein
VPCFSLTHNWLAQISSTIRAISRQVLLVLDEFSTASITVKYASLSITILNKCMLPNGKIHRPFSTLGLNNYCRHRLTAEIFWPKLPNIFPSDFFYYKDSTKIFFVDISFWSPSQLKTQSLPPKAQGTKNDPWQLRI